MYRTHTCGQLRIENVNESVCLSGWVQKVRKLGAMTFVDLRDRYGITQLVVEESASEEIKNNVAKLGREFVIQVRGTVIERASKNNKIPTGDIEITVKELTVLSESEIPPFTIEDQTDGGDEIRMKYRYLDLRRACVRTFPHEPGTILRPAAKPADLETTTDGFRFRPLFPDREVFPG